MAVSASEFPDINYEKQAELIEVQIDSVIKEKFNPDFGFVTIILKEVVKKAGFEKLHDKTLQFIETDYRTAGWFVSYRDERGSVNDDIGPTLVISKKSYGTEFNK